MSRVKNKWCIYFETIKNNKNIKRKWMPANTEWAKRYEWIIAVYLSILQLDMCFTVDKSELAYGHGWEPSCCSGHMLFACVLNLYIVGLFQRLV